MVGKICGTGSYVPSRVMDNDDLSKIVDTNDEWIRGEDRDWKAPYYR